MGSRGGFGVILGSVGFGGSTWGGGGGFGGPGELQGVPKGGGGWGGLRGAPGPVLGSPGFGVPPWDGPDPVLGSLNCGVSPGAGDRAGLGSLRWGSVHGGAHFGVPRVWGDPIGLTPSPFWGPWGCPGGLLRVGCCEARTKARQTPAESDHASPFYCPNSPTFIVNFTGADSVSHKIIGQKHSDKL